VNHAYLGLGSNLGDRAGYLRHALNLLVASSDLEIGTVSSLYETAPMEITEQPAFLNAAAAVRTHLSPRELLSLVKETERAVGRIERIRFGPREVDIDILLYNDLVLAGDELTIPHPRLATRAFALVPLAELAPRLILPGAAGSIASLIPAALAGGAVTRVQGPEWVNPPEPG
jgi:2-amino-4-hydroxy-6-hydroxymethyldihydropteridine diphosphokinase